MHDSTPHSGEVTSREQSGPITLTRVQYSPGTRLRNHAHDKACFALIQCGGYVEAFGSRRFSLLAGNVLFRPAGEEHVDEFCTAYTRCLLVEVTSEWLDRIREFGPFQNGPALSRGPQMAQIATALHIQAEQKDAAAALAIEGLSYELGAELLRQSVPKQINYPPRWLRQVHAQLSEDPSNKFDLRELAAQVGIHPVHLSRQFRRFYGLNLGDFLRKRRVELSADRILRGDGTLGEIAASLGFPNQSQFTRAFHNIMGLTPSDYKHTYRKSKKLV